MKRRYKNVTEQKQLNFQYWNTITELPKEWISNVDIILKEIDVSNELEKAEANYKGFIK